MGLQPAIDDLAHHSAKVSTSTEPMSPLEHVRARLRTMNRDSSSDDELNSSKRTQSKKRSRSGATSRWSSEPRMELLKRALETVILFGNKTCEHLSTDSVETLILFGNKTCEQPSPDSVEM
jgi:hypothetical protein